MCNVDLFGKREEHLWAFLKILIELLELPLCICAFSIQSDDMISRCLKLVYIIMLELVDMPWRTLSLRNKGFIGHVARYAPSSTSVSERNTAPIHIN